MLSVVKTNAPLALNTIARENFADNDIRESTKLSELSKESRELILSLNPGQKRLLAEYVSHIRASERLEVFEDRPLPPGAAGELDEYMSNRASDLETRIIDAGINIPFSNSQILNELDAYFGQASTIIEIKSTSNPSPQLNLENIAGSRFRIEQRLDGLSDAGKAFISALDQEQRILLASYIEYMDGCDKLGIFEDKAIPPGAAGELDDYMSNRATKFEDQLRDAGIILPDAENIIWKDINSYFS